MSCRIILIAFFSLVHSVCAITIDSIIHFSDSCVGIEWTPDSVNTDPTWYTQYGTLCTGSDSIYKKCDFIPGLTYSGIAYSYGGEDPWYIFRDRLQAGFLVGSHLCHYKLYKDPSDKVTGTDCSGFLSFVWNVPRVTTTYFLTSGVYPIIPFNEIKAGDALVKASKECGYHAILIVEAYDLKEVVISEASSSVRGCRERLVDLTSPAWSCYKAIRHPKFVNIIPQIYNTAPNSQILQCTFNINQETIQLKLTQPFTGTISMYLPNGIQLFKKTFEFPKSIFSINKSEIQSSVVFISIEPSKYHKAAVFKIVVL